MDVETQRSGDVENPRSIRETTVCPACQAEFHKDHPTCPECNTVLDPAFRVARQTKRAVQEVSELVVENTRTTRQIFVYVLRLLIGGFLWALVVLSAVSSIVALFSQRLTVNWWGVPVLVTMVWLARRISPGHFRPRPQLNNESASTPAAGSLKVSQTGRSVPRTAMPLHNYLVKRELETQSEAPIVEKTPQPFESKPVPENSSPDMVLALLCLVIITPIVAGIYAMISADRVPLLFASSAATTNQGTSLTREDLSTTYSDHDLSVDYHLRRIARQEAQLRVRAAQDEAEEKARRQQLGTFEKVRETAADFLVPRRR